jgi:hypothetical protein
VVTGTQISWFVFQFTIHKHKDEEMQNYDLYSLPNIIQVIKQRIRWAGNVAHVGGGGGEERGIQNFGAET